MSAQTFFLAFFVGSSLVAFWIALRFPHLGPHSIVGAAVVVLVALATGEVVGPVMDAARALPIGDPTIASLFGGAFPILVFAFLSFAWLIRAANDVITRHRI